MVIIIKNACCSISYERVLQNVCYLKENSIWSQIDLGLSSKLCVFGQANSSFKYLCPHPCHGNTKLVCHY